MAKWADYGISHVRYDAQHTHIQKVRVRADQGEDFGDSHDWSRVSVVNSIERGNTFVTILRDSDGKYRRGQDVHVVTIDGVKYIRTDQNSTAADNLGSLPEF
jgi:hypothetical protein